MIMNAITAPRNASSETSRCVAGIAYSAGEVAMRVSYGLALPGATLIVDRGMTALLLNDIPPTPYRSVLLSRNVFFRPRARGAGVNRVLSENSDGTDAVAYQRTS